jgi:hypothetical protein
MQRLWLAVLLVVAGVAVATGVTVGVLALTRGPLPPLTLIRPPGKLLAERSGVGRGSVSITVTTPQAVYALVCRGRGQLQVLSLRVPRCSPDGSLSYTTIGNNLPPGAGHKIVSIEASPDVQWEFLAVASPRTPS